MKYVSKLISIQLSLLMLTACIPMEVFAQDHLSSWELTLKKLVASGAAEEITERYVSQPVFAGQEHGGMRILHNDGSLGWKSKSWFDSHYEPVETPAGWYRYNRPIKAIKLKEDLEYDEGYYCSERFKKGEVVFDAPSISSIGYKPDQWADAIPISKYNEAKFLEEAAPAWTQKELASFLLRGDGKQFGQPDIYAKFARVQAVQAKGGEVVETILKDGMREAKNIAKAGDFIVTNPGGEKYIVTGDKFAKKYEAALDLGEGWFKPKGTPQKFVQINQDMVVMASWGERQVLKKGAYLNVTDLNDIYGVAADEFRGTYKTIRALYQENLKGIRLLAMKVEQKLYKKFPKYSGVFFKRVLANDTDFMIKRLEQQAAKRAERNATKAGAKKVALRAFGGALFGSVLYFGITLATAPDAEGFVPESVKKSDVIKRTAANVKGLSGEQKDMLADIATFMDPNARPLIVRDPELMEKMGVYSAIIQSEEFDVDSAAEFIVDELSAIEAQGAMPAQIKQALKS